MQEQPKDAPFQNAFVELSSYKRGESVFEDVYSLFLYFPIKTTLANILSSKKTIVQIVFFSCKTEELKPFNRQRNNTLLNGMHNLIFPMNIPDTNTNQSSGTVKKVNKLSLPEKKKEKCCRQFRNNPTGQSYPACDNSLYLRNTRDRRKVIIL